MEVGGPALAARSAELLAATLWGGEHLPARGDWVTFSGHYRSTVK